MNTRVQGDLKTQDPFEKTTKNPKKKSIINSIDGNHAVFENSKKTFNNPVVGAVENLVDVVSNSGCPIAIVGPESYGLDPLLEQLNIANKRPR